MQQEIDLVKNADFLKLLDVENVKTFFVKIIVLGPSMKYQEIQDRYLDEVAEFGAESAEAQALYASLLGMQRDVPLREIQGRTSAGSITIDGNSAVRRAGNLTFLAEEAENDLTDIDNLLSINKKIQIYVGLKNTIDSKNYGDIIWFNQGVFVITGPSLTHATNGVSISLQFKDKMCLLNGDCGGNLPTSITFDNYDQVIGFKDCGEGYPSMPNTYTVYKIGEKYYMWNSTTGWYESSKNQIGQTISVQQRVFDIILTLVCNYGGEAISNIFINDVPLELKNVVRYIGSSTLFFNPEDSQYTVDVETGSSQNWVPFNYNEDCGYVYTDFVYPGKTGSLVSSIGDNVCTVLDKIKTTLGNYEYFYDVNGHFIFQEVKNYLNTQYSPVQTVDKSTQLTTSGLLISKDNYYIDLSNNKKSSYTFEEGSTLISSYTNTPDYANIKNDFHIWGKAEDAKVIHYHIAIKQKPVPPYRTRSVIAEKDSNGYYTGKIHLASQTEMDENNIYITDNKLVLSKNDASVNNEIVEDHQDLGNIHLGDNKVIISSTKVSVRPNSEVIQIDYAPSIINYTPTDWRAELYMRGLEKKMRHQRPDIYEQELLDLFDSIYDMREQKYKADIVNHPNDLSYWIDFINPTELFDISVDAIGSRIYSYQQDKIKKLYNTDVPNLILINSNNTDMFTYYQMIDKCDRNSQPFSIVDQSVFDNLAIGTYGYTAVEVARDLLYQYTDYSASINLTSIPIYYLEPNSRISVYDKASGICGDYIIKSINLPLDAKSSMSITATKALERV